MSLTFLSPRVSPAQLALATGVALFAGNGAWGQSSPYVIGASETITHDSNLLHLADGAPIPPRLVSVTDWIATTTLFGGIDQPFGRQRGYANLSVRDNHFRYNDYDNIAYGLVGGLDWSTIERISGTVRLDSNRTLANFDLGVGTTRVVEKNIEQTNQLAATVSIGGVTDLTFDGGLRYQTQHFSAVGDKLKQSELSLGARHRLGGELTLGAGLRFTNGRYSDLGDKFSGRNLDITAKWVPSPISTVDARLSLGKTDHTLASAQDFSGATGSIRWDWKPTGRLALSALGKRVTGNESAFTTNQEGGQTVSSQSDDSRLSSTIGLSANYEVTSKILFTSGYTHVSRRLTNFRATGTADTVTASDRLNRIQLGLRYLPTRTVELSCNIGRDSRRATPETTELTNSYSARVVACAAQLSVNP